MNKRLRKKKLKQKRTGYIELPLEKLQDIELLESGKLDGEERRKTLKERLGKCFYPEINFEAIKEKYNDMLERVKEKLENEEINNKN